MGWQRFYVESSGATAGTMWYCGALLHNMDQPELAGQQMLDAFSGIVVANDTVKFCLNLTIPRSYGHSPDAPWPWQPPTSCTGCGCGAWTLQLQPDGTLRSTMMMVDQSYHLDVLLHRVGPPVPVPWPMPGHGANFSCAFQKGGRGAGPVHGLDMGNARARESAVPRSCPFHHQLRHRHHKQEIPIPTASTHPDTQKDVDPKPGKSTPRTTSRRHPAEDFPNCYVINTNISLQLEWRLDEEGQQLHCRLSAPTTASNTYLAIGFRPLAYAPVGNGKGLVPDEYGTGTARLFGMQGADIVLGAPSAAKVMGFYADQFTGAPVPSDYLDFSNASVTRSSVTGVTRVTFTRPLVGGYLWVKHKVQASIASPLADLLWAMGVMSGDVPQYHGTSRGLRTINWKDPQVSAGPFACSH